MVQLVVEVLQGLVRVIPRAAPDIRDTVVLNQVSALVARMDRAMQAGDQALKEIAALVGDACTTRTWWKAVIASR